jgi:hypothetical protein
LQELAVSLRLKRWSFWLSLVVAVVEQALVVVALVVVAVLVVIVRR